MRVENELTGTLAQFGGMFAVVGEREERRSEPRGVTGRNEQRVPTPGFASDPAWSPLLTAT